MAIEAKDFVSGVAIIVFAAIAVGGWLIAAQQQRSHHRFQRRIEQRLWMLEHVVQAISPLASPSVVIPHATDLRDSLVETELYVQLFGYTDEQVMDCSLLRALDSGHTEETRVAIGIILTTIQKHLRKEVGFPE